MHEREEQSEEQKRGAFEGRYHNRHEADGWYYALELRSALRSIRTADLPQHNNSVCCSFISLPQQVCTAEALRMHTYCLSFLASERLPSVRTFKSYVTR